LIVRKGIGRLRASQCNSDHTNLRRISPETAAGNRFFQLATQRP
jgi:hypothetical protein